MATESVTARSLLITGTVGVGKTSVLLETGEQPVAWVARELLVRAGWEESR